MKTSQERTVRVQTERGAPRKDAPMWVFVIVAALAVLGIFYGLTGISHKSHLFDRSAAQATLPPVANTPRTEPMSTSKP